MKTNIITCLALLALLALCGCTSVKYSRTDSTGEKVTFTTTSFATKKTIGDVNFSKGTNQTQSLAIKGYNNDQVTAVGIAVDAAVKAAVKSVIPTP